MKIVSRDKTMTNLRRIRLSMAGGRALRLHVALFLAVFFLARTAALAQETPPTPSHTGADGRGRAAGEEAARIDAELSGSLIRVVLVPRNEATLSAEISGKVQKLHRLLGASFARNDELVTMEDAFFLAALGKANATLKAATVTLESLADLRTRNDASLTELENARRDVSSAQAELELAKRNFRACHVIAPYGGRVADVFLNEHELVEPGRPLLRIIDDTVLLGHVFLSGDVYNDMKNGGKIPVYIGRDGIRPFLSGQAAQRDGATGLTTDQAAGQTTGEFCRISPVIDPASGAFEAYVQIDNAAGHFRAGMEAWLRAVDLPGRAAHE